MLRVRPHAPTRGPEERVAGPSRLCGRSLLSPPGRKCRLYLRIRPSARPWRLWGTPAVPLEPDTAGGFRLALLVRNRISRFLSSHLAPRAGDLRKHLARRGVEAAGLCRPSPPPPLRRHRPARRACLPRSPAAPALGCSRGTLLRPLSVVSFFRARSYVIPSRTLGSDVSGSESQ